MSVVYPVTFLDFFSWAYLFVELQPAFIRCSHSCGVDVDFLGVIFHVTIDNVLIHSFNPFYHVLGKKLLSLSNSLVDLKLTFQSRDQSGCLHLANQISSYKD